MEQVRCRPLGGDPPSAVPGRPRPWSRSTTHRAAAGWVAVLCLAAGAAVMVGAGPAGAAPTATTTPAHTATTPTAPPLEAMVLAQTLPGFSPVAPGATNGPLTPEEFASQSSDPTTASEEFSRLAARPGFGASIRLWTDRAGPGHGANDVAVLLFRIPDAVTGRAFTDGLLAAFAHSRATRPFPVPSIAGARGYSLSVTSPLAATEQVVVFRAGRYVAMVQLASETSAANPAALGPAQAVTVSYQQDQLLRLLDPRGVVDTAAGRVGPTAPARTPGSSKRSTAGTPASSTDSAAIAGLVVLAALALGAGAWLLLRRRRGASVHPAAAGMGDAWEPGGVFDSFGAVDPRMPATAEGGGPPQPGGGARRPARAVPALVPTMDVADVADVADVVDVADADVDVGVGADVEVGVDGPTAAAESTGASDRSGAPDPLAPIGPPGGAGERVRS